MSSVTETSTSALGKQGEIGRQIESLRSIRRVLDQESLRCRKREADATKNQACATFSRETSRTSPGYAIDTAT